MTSRAPRQIDAALAARIAYQVDEIKRVALASAIAASALRAEHQRRYERMKREMGW